MNSTTTAGFQCVKCGRNTSNGTWVGNEGPYCVECSTRFLQPVDTGEIYGAQVAVSERQCHWTYKEGEGIVSSCKPAWTWEPTEAGSFAFCPNCGGRIVRNEP